MKAMVTNTHACQLLSGADVHGKEGVLLILKLSQHTELYLEVHAGKHWWVKWVRASRPPADQGTLD